MVRFEMGLSSKEEQKAPIHERIDNLQLKVSKLVGEANGNLDRVKVDELGATAEGQGKLLKLYEASRRFTSRVSGTVEALAAGTMGVRLFDLLSSSPADQAFLSHTGNFLAGVTVLAVLWGAVATNIKAIGFEKRAKGVLTSMSTK